MSRKSCYLLLELMIAFALLALVISPLVKPIFSSLKAEASALEHIRMRRIADLRFADFKAALLSNQLPKESLPKEIGKRVIYKKTPHGSFEETFYLKLKRNQASKEGKESFLYLAEIKYSSSRKKSPTFLYEVMLKDE